MTRLLWNLIPTLAWLVAATAWADANHCDVCEVAFTGTYYTHGDAVTGEKKMICKDCVLLKSTCFICGMPAKLNITTLKDGRILCERDAKTAVIEDDDAYQACREAKNGMDRLFSRFLDFPGTNVSTRIVDRVHLRELFKEPGEDYACPNVWGYIESRTNQHQLQHNISLLSALPRASFKATCAHEYGHAWLNQNLSAHRRKSLGKDANEGFCELIAYLLMDSENEEAQKRIILANRYTRGQVQLFIEAHRAYGMNDVADWMRYGVDEELSADSPQRIRSVLLPRATTTFATVSTAQSPPPAPIPAVLTLKAVFMNPTRPEAVINNRTFQANETASVKVGATNVTVRCLVIGEDYVRIKVVSSGEEQELRLKQK